MFQTMQGSWRVLPLNPPVLLCNSNETILPTVLFPGKEKPKHKSIGRFLSLLSSIQKNLCGVSELCIPPGRKECTYLPSFLPGARNKARCLGPITTLQSFLKSIFQN